MAKKCKPGLLWAARDHYTESDNPAEQLVYISEGPPTRSVGCWVFDFDTMILCRKPFRRHHGRAPRKDQAICIDTTRREWWCSECQEWVQPESVAWELDDNTGEWYPAHEYCLQKLTCSRCIVVETLRLKDAEEKK